MLNMLYCVVKVISKTVQHPVHQYQSFVSFQIEGFYPSCSKPV